MIIKGSLMRHQTPELFLYGKVKLLLLNLIDAETLGGHIIGDE
jgi:hypothetical protein